MMRGLLLKDWYNLLKNGKFLFIFEALYIVLGAATNKKFFIVFGLIFFSLQSINLMSMDEKSKWEGYAVMLPYNRRDIVAGKYVITVGGILATALVYLILLAGMQTLHIAPGGKPVEFVVRALELLPIIAACVIYISIQLPLAFKLGTEKSKLWTMVFSVLFVFLVMGLINVFPIFSSGGYVGKLMGSRWGGVGAFAASLVILLLSAAVSVQFYRGREL